MKTIQAALATVLLLCACTARAGDPWSEADIYRETGYMALLATDWAQTRYNARAKPYIYGGTSDGHGGQTPIGTWQPWETNPILGKHPSVGRVDAYFAAGAALHLVVADALSSKWRSRLQWTTIAIEAVYVRHNLQLGIAARF